MTKVTGNRTNKANNQISELDRVILTTIKLIIFFVISILIYYKIARILGYQVFLLEDPEEQKYIQHTYVRKGYKIYSLHYEENYDITSWEKNMKYWGYIGDYRED